MIFAYIGFFNNKNTRLTIIMIFFFKKNSFSVVLDVSLKLLNCETIIDGDDSTKAPILETLVAGILIIFFKKKMKATISHTHKNEKKKKLKCFFFFRFSHCLFSKWCS